MPESTEATTGDHVAQNRAAWDRMAADYVEGGRRNWASDEVTWGIFDVPESRIGMLPPDLTGMDTVELGCGTAYVSAWLARRAARPDGVRARIPAPSRRRRADTVRRRELRLRHQRVWRRHLVRPLPLDPGSGSHPAS